MRNALIIIGTLILISFSDTLFSQELNVVLEPGLGSFRMKDLKEINSMTLASLPFDAEIADNFPTYWTYKSSLLFAFRRFVTLGITGCYQSTGSRVSRADYSGEYAFDTRIRSFSPGIIIEFNYNIDKYRLSFSNEVGMEYSRLGLREYLMVGTESHENEYAFTAKNIYYEPAFKVSYPVSFFRVGLIAGYLIDVKREPLSGPNGNLILSNGKTARSDWSGIRFGVLFSYNIFQAFKPSS